MLEKDNSRDCIVQKLRIEEQILETKYREVYERCEAGETCKVLANEYGVSEKTIVLWCDRFVERESLMRNEVYRTLYKLAGYRKLATKAYTILKRNNCHTKDTIVLLSDEDIFGKPKWRNCGAVCEKLIAECRDFFKNNLG